MSPEDVLTFWFGPPGSPPLARVEAWWKKDDAFDAEIRTRFGAAIERASGGAFHAWRETPRGRLALVILLDQLSRNAFRGTPRAFAQDALAREVASEALAAEDPRALAPLETSFLLMPWMHAESAAMQRKCVAEFERLCGAASDASLAAVLANNLDYARKHEAVVARFGRFPHRDAILGRPTTDEERAFLEQPGSSF